MTDLYIIYFTNLVFLIFTAIFFLRNINKFREVEKRVLVYLIISTLGWITANAISDLSKQYSIAFFSAQIAILFPLNVAYAIFLISRILPQTIDTDSKYKKHEKFVTIIPIIFNLLLLPFITSTYNINHFEIVLSGPAYFEPGILFPIVMLLSLALILLSITTWSTKSREVTLLQKHQIRILQIGLIFVAFTLSIGFIIFPYLNLSVYTPFAFLSISVVLYLIQQNLIAKNVGMNIRLFIYRILLYSFILILAIALFQLLNIIYKFNQNIITIGILVAFNFIILYNIYTYLQTLLFPQKQEESIIKFADVSNTIFDLKKLIELLEDTLHSFLPNDKSKVIVIDNTPPTKIKVTLHYWKKYRNYNILTPEILVDSYLNSNNKKEKQDILHIYKNIQKSNYNVMIPLYKRNDIQGVILINLQTQILSRRSLDNLQLLTKNASIAISRALLYKEVQDLASSLEQKVKQRTAQLQRQMTKLRELRQRERDMIDIMGHELRTPISIVNLGFPRFIRFSQPKPKQEKKYKEYIQKINLAIQREIDLIETLLAATKLDSKKMELKLDKVNPIDIIIAGKSGFVDQAKEKKLHIRIVDQDCIGKLPAVKADPFRLQETLDNFISNAIKYTDKGEITLSAKKATVKNRQYVQFTIQDTGQGISRKDIPHLGKKFYRAKQHVNHKGVPGPAIVRPGGTGLGLYVAYGLIKQHGGKVKVKSKLGEGSTFSFTMPVWEEGKKEESLRQTQAKRQGKSRKKLKQKEP